MGKMYRARYLPEGYFKALERRRGTVLLRLSRRRVLRDHHYLVAENTTYALPRLH